MTNAENPITQLLNRMVQWHASDLHLQSGFVPFVRIEGKLRPVDCRPAEFGETGSGEQDLDLPSPGRGAVSENRDVERHWTL